MMNRSLLLAATACLTLTSLSAAQDFNVDIGTANPAPGATFGGAAALPGTWNSLSAATPPVALLDTAGAVTTVMLTRVSGQAVDFNFNNVGTSGDDERLLDDLQDIGNPGLSTTWVISNLAAGTYNVFTYAFAPDSPTFFTNVVVNGSAPTTVGGNWAGAYVAGATHAVNSVTIGASGSITIVLTGFGTFGSFNGVQLDRVTLPPPTFTPYCFGDGTGTPCPCGNSGLAGNGCASSINANGANLAASGSPSIANDTLVLTGSGMPTTGSALYFQGTQRVASGNGAVFGDGLRCAGGAVIRLGTKLNAAGSSSYPEVGDPSISVKGVNLAGDVRDYQCWYRNSAVFCNPETFNLTNAVELTWVP